MKNILIGDKVEFVDVNVGWQGSKEVKTVGKVIGITPVMIYGKEQTLLEIDVGTNVSKIICSLACKKI